MTIRYAGAAALTAAAALMSSNAAAQFSCISYAAPELIMLPRYINSIDCADVDQDGHFDLIGTSQNVVRIYYGASTLGAGVIESFQVEGSSEKHPTFVVDAKVGELTGDSELDIALLMLDPPRVRILSGMGDRNLGEPVDYLISFEEEFESLFVTLTVADLNSDNVDDVFVGLRGHSLGRSNPILLSNSDGGMTFEPGPAITHGSINCKAVDIDADGDLDIVSASPKSPAGAVVIFDNTGDGHFTSRLYEPALQEFMGEFDNTGPTCTAPADFDLDGDIDLAVMTVIGTVSIFEQVDDGEFIESLVLRPGDFGWFIHAADLDGDGRSDLILGRPLGGARLQIIENTSAGGEFAFGSPFAISSSGFPRFILTQDFDEHPGIDVLFAAAAEDVTGGFGLASAALPEEVDCVYDLSGNGIVDPIDLSIVLAFWDAPGSPADLTQDRIVNMHDVATLLSTWGAVANPSAAFPQYNWGYGQRTADTAERQAIHDMALSEGADANADGRVSPVELADWIAAR